MRIVYLHGFASGPRSSKAQFFGHKFAELGVPFSAPELDEGDFQQLTLTRMVAVAEREIERALDPNSGFGGGEAGEPERKVVLFGSSLGGFLATVCAARYPALVDRLVLMAPALHFAQRWRARFSADELAQWKQDGFKPFYHYGLKEQSRLGYGFVEDAERYPDQPDFPQPALILHGKSDPVVPSSASEDFAARHGNIRLRLYPSGHELTDVLEPMWTEVAAFLGLSPGRF